MATEFEHGPDMYTPEDVIKILKIILHSPGRAGRKLWKMRNILRMGVW